MLQRRFVSILMAAVLVGTVALVLPGKTYAASTGGGSGIPGSQTYVYVDYVYGTYDGYYDSSTGYGCVGPCTATWTETMGFSNSFGVEISTSVSLSAWNSPISAKVGYSVTSSSSRAFSAAFTVPAGYTGTIRYNDWYHVKKLVVHTITCYWAGCNPAVYGTAWAAQWYQRIFYISLR